MRKNWRTIPCVLAAVLLLCVGTLLPAKAANFDPGFETASAAAVLIDLDNGEALYQKNADERLPQASTTKVMTFIVAAEQISDPANTEITVTQNALDQIPDLSFVTAQLREGEKMSALDLMYCMLIPSASDAANALADYVGNGDIQSFVDRMNQKAEELGCTNTHYTNVFGNYDEQNYTTVNDLAKIYQYAETLPHFQEIVSQASYTVPATNYSPARNLQSSVKLLDPSSSYYYEYCTGGKTGTTDQAGYCLASTASNDQLNLLCVTMGAPSVRDGVSVEDNGAFTDASQLYAWAFSSLQQQEVLPANQQVSTLPVLEARDRDQTLSVIPAQAYTALLPEGAAEQIETSVSLPANVTAPVAQGQKLGTVTLTYNGQELATVDLVAAVAIEQYIPIYQRPWFRIAVLIAGAVIIVLLVIFLVRALRKRRSGRFGGHHRGGYGRGKHTASRSRYRSRGSSGRHHYH